MSKLQKIIIFTSTGLVFVAGITIGFIALWPEEKKITTPEPTVAPPFVSGAPDPTTATPNGDIKDVDITASGFSVPALTVAKGTKVTWTNKDSKAHTVTVDEGYGPLSKEIAAGETYSFIFDIAGTFGYHCELHPEMKASVTVTES